MSIDHDNHPDEDLLFFRKMEVKEIKMESGTWRRNWSVAAMFGTVWLISDLIPKKFENLLE